MDLMLLLNILVFVMLVAALIAVETSNLLSSIISMGAIGFLLSIVYLVLGAPEIAITQIVVEIVVLVILIRATINRDLTSVAGDREFVGLLFTVAMVFVFSLIGLRVFGGLPPFGVPVMDRIADVPSLAYLTEGLKKLGSDNVVQTVLLGFRSYDTLGVTAALLCAIIGALALLRSRTRTTGGVAEDGDASDEILVPHEGMSLIVKATTRWVKGFILLFGLFLILYSHKSPGGGFTGGVIIACALILVTLAEGQSTGMMIGRNMAFTLAAVGALVVLAVQVLDQTEIGRMFGISIAETSAAHPVVFNIAPAQLTEIGIGMAVSASLYLAFCILATMHVHVQDGKRRMVRRRRG